jgi:hypothetical protein
MTELKRDDDRKIMPNTPGTPRTRSGQSCDAKKNLESGDPEASIFPCRGVVGRFSFIHKLGYVDVVLALCRI